MRFFINSETDPAYNLALEETLFRKFPEPFLMLWRNRSSVIVGKNQNTLAEVDAAFAETHHIAVIRRITGGGAVYHDLGNVNYSLLIPERHPEADCFATFARPVVEALQKMGIPARFSGRNDIEADGRKFSGNAFYCVGKNKCHHGTVLIASDMGRLSNYLTVSKTKLEAKGIKSVRSRVVNLTELAPEMTVEAFERALIEAFAPDMTLPMPNEALYADRAEFLGSREWLLGSDPEFTDEIKYRTDEGEFTLHLTVKGEIVTDCTVYTDSLEPTAAERICAEVIGKRFEEMQNAKGKMQN